MGGSRRVPLPTTIVRSRSTSAVASRAKAAKRTKVSRVPKATARRAAAAKARTAAARKSVARGGSTAKSVAGAAAKARGNATATATYVYCVVRSVTPPVVAGGLEPMPGGDAPRALPIAPDTWLVAAEVPLKVFGQDALNKRLQDVDWMSRCGVAHQAVVESFLGGDAVVPMTLFTIFASDERAIAEAKKDAARLDASLDRVAGRTEWVVRVLRGDAPASAGTAASHAARTTAGAAPRSGREFLQAKVNQRQAARRAAEETSHAVSALMTALSDAADDISDRTEARAIGALTSAALLDAAFLVARTAEPQFEQAARRMAQPLAERGFRVSVTGPWPCYSFVSSRP
jgi:hypothetical protein